MRGLAAVDPAVTILIPAYNEERRLAASLAEVRRFCMEQHITSEVIVVDDGSSDHTADVVLAEAQSWDALRLVSGPHAGKGGAIRAGVLEARGHFVAIADADLSMPIDEFTRFNTDVFAHCDIAIGSREAPGARRYNESFHRHLMGRVFNTLVRVLVLPDIKDTQCGFKVLPRSVALELCRLQTIDGWGFDVEWMVIARHHGYRIREVPINWYHDGAGSRISPLRDSLRMARELWRIRSNLISGAYDGVPAATTSPISDPIPFGGPVEIKAAPAPATGPASAG